MEELPSTFKSLQTAAIKALGLAVDGMFEGVGLGWLLLSKLMKNH